MTATAPETALLSLLETIVAMRSDAGGPTSLAVVESTIRSGEMPPLHAHDEDEAVYVLEGTLTVHSGYETVGLEVGDAFLLPRGLPHTHRADSRRARYVTMTFARSVGHYEDFLRAVARPADGSEADGWSSREEALPLAAVAHANSIMILGPPGTLPA